MSDDSDVQFTSEHATPSLRWIKRANEPTARLQQQYEIRVVRLNGATTMRHEWRDVPWADEDDK